ncbi:MAG TPA: VWA domain-containing protein [Salinivirga sp.]|uniref:vWA domain-containing protein n=1 Tax=Salinivirga sp. TaxID=1970192 RepID=UPI002B47CF68|nr:VWA domain-containing protein [Salinivirga sp.]HKK59683.1 VWA domain-containing protein [Salinivirga sp.]
MRQILIAIILLIITTTSFGQQPDRCTRILFVLDASRSMTGNWESARKIDVARRLLSRMVDSLDKKDNVEMALRVYGHQSYVPPQDCEDTRLEVPFAEKNAGRIQMKLKMLEPKGTTPIAYSLQQAAKDFPNDDCRNVIILITDGIEACEGDPCAVSRDLQKRGIILKPFVVGIGLDPDFKETFNCVGKYYDASNEDRFEDVMGVVISQALNNTTVQVNLLDAYGNATETNVGMTFYDMFSKMPRYNYFHTINLKGVPDTIILDPLSDYRMVVHTLPPISKDSISISPGTHNIIGIDAPRGTLLLKRPKGAQYRDLQFLVEDLKGELVHVQTVERKERYITGYYNIEVLTLPRLKIDSVEISQSHTTKIQIPEPGIANFSAYQNGYCAVYVIQNDKVKWVANLPEDESFSSLVLLPGKYMAIYRPISAHNVLEAIKKEFEIKSGASVRVTFY